MQKYEKHNYRVASRRSVDGKPAVSGRHRPRASIACNNCRTRKVKVRPESRNQFPTEY